MVVVHRENRYGDWKIMHINKNSSIQLDEGEQFLSERQDEGNIWRTIKLRLASGGIVTVQRHFSQIGPVILRPDGTHIDTHLDRATGSVVESKKAI
jgi:hypothetical protein